ncbi:MAG: response regulator [Nitrososphaera sp.]|uniref:response regulator n=1 Tax=Candidatus Nitrososphaera gargensis TaxID=497727 RepID=UPI00164F2D97|nr:response regulator [Candidatus Nitrososphaera gargensis]
MVDDEQDVLTVFKKALGSKGYEVDAFNDPTKALIDFAPGRYDIVITDVKMP